MQSDVNFAISLIVPLGSCLASVVGVVLVDGDNSAIGLLVEWALPFFLVDLMITWPKFLADWKHIEYEKKAF